VLKEARTIARQAAEAGDDGTNDLLVSGIIRTNELEVWFLRGACGGHAACAGGSGKRCFIKQLNVVRVISKVRLEGEPEPRLFCSAVVEPPGRG
jgi:hypothetical protein